MIQKTRPARLASTAWIAASLAIACAGCATMGGSQGQPLVPTRHETRTGPYAVFSNFPIAPDAPAIRSLQSLEAEIEATLGIRVAADVPPVEVYILNDREAFTHFLTFYYPDLPSRRAFFLAQGDRRVVYTFLGDRLEEDLRHEATHALMNVAIGDMPLWLDEGLAEYFEGPDGRKGVNPEHLSRLPNDLAKGWKPDLAKLESLQSVREMDPRDYREAWAWVHFLLDGPNSGKATLLAYLADIHTSTKTRSLSERLQGNEQESGSQLIAHLERVRATPVASARPTSEPTFRLQDNGIEPPVAVNPRRRGFFGRLGALLGL